MWMHKVQSEIICIFLLLSYSVLLESAKGCNTSI
jgi:hypothetical protein